MAQLNSKWLVSATVKNEDGTRRGSVKSVNGDNLLIQTLKGFVIESAIDLVEKGLITNNNSPAPQYL